MGLERSFYDVSELVGVVEVCTVVFMPVIAVCPIQFPFNIMFSTTDNTAGNVYTVFIAMQAMTVYFYNIPVATMDYGSVSMIVWFATCHRRECVNITIENDGVAEPLESFFVTLKRTPDIDGRITLDPVDGEIMIIDATGT